MSLEIEDPVCYHRPTGYVCWPARYDPRRPHASINCCDRAECVAAASDWVTAHTGNPGTYHPFGETRRHDENEG